MTAGMVKVRVLVVDDSVTIRRLITDALSGDPEIEVIGTAANGRIALAKIIQSPPDIVTLDVEMPELDGLATLAEIRKTHPALPVVMFSTLTERAAKTTLDALALGATDYFTKPTGVGSLSAATKLVREELGARLKALVRRRSVADTTTSRPNLAPASPPLRLPTGLPARPELLAIGASTGGPNAIAEVLSKLRVLPVPGVITQHMPPLFTRLFSQRLAATTPHRVREAVDGDALEPGLFLVAPGDHHMLLVREGVRTVVRLNQGPPESSCRPAVDPMLRTAVDVYGPGVLAVILTGMGQDGLRGCELVRARGGDVIAQDEATSVVWGMPGFVARAKLASSVVPLPFVSNQIAARIFQERGLATGTEVRHGAR